MANTDNYIRRKGTTPNTSTVISSKVKIYAGTSATDQVGVIANFDPSESRSAEPVRGIGFGDQIAELVPGMTDAISISVGRTAQYLSNLFAAFGYKGGIQGMVRSLKHHRWPFDIKQEIVVSWLVENSGSVVDGYNRSSDSHDTGDNVTVTSSTVPGANAGEEITTTSKVVNGTAGNLHAIKTIYEGCWFTDFSTSYTSDTTIVQETGTIMCSDVYNDVANSVLPSELAGGNTDSGLNTAANTGSTSNRGTASLVT